MAALIFHSFALTSRSLRGRGTCDMAAATPTARRGRVGNPGAVLGYAKTFTSTKRQDFLDAATGAAEQFIFALESVPAAVEEPQHGGRGR
ncbi:unsaturated glucuronyl hydrolase [Penicillium canescens]|uniref:Unsaturated glucuronyl hydrolase n=1 Tax=Penicillium canescens TaxID=5083 RepID=A0AAD6N3Q1_PENCN|nr:unsaturated glucuronyl hydrolase [Penicillium canescens]KAJ6026846.1 unsaturated glucuronyl hydrolase [Penicillium canescens]KAJ6040132.1 unsaturated glucuronyl hydrolase [Penicillium canescens]KAJ6067517.1 unsaturated glucuronyl hydrolase [Penicillium canescens]